VKKRANVKGKSYVLALAITATVVTITVLLFALLREHRKPAGKADIVKPIVSPEMPTTATVGLATESLGGFRLIQKEIRTPDEDQFHWAVMVGPIADGEYYYRFDVDGHYVLDKGNPETKDLGMRRGQYNVLHIPPREIHAQPIIDLPRREVTFNYFDEVRTYIRLEASFADWSVGEIYLEPVSRLARSRQQEIDRSTTITVVAGVVQIESGTAVPNVKVLFSARSIPEYPRVPDRAAGTDDQGHFMAKGLAAASYMITLVSAEYYLKDNPVIDVTEGDRITNLVLVAQQGGSICGKVVNESYEPLAGAQIVLIPHYDAFAVHPVWGMNYVKKVETDQSGRFQHLGVRDGIYDLAASHSFYSPYFEEQIRIRNEQIVEEETIVLHPGCRICGHVLDSAGGPVEKARVAVSWTFSAAYSEPRSFAEVKKAETDGKGGFAIEGLPAKAVNIQVTADNYLPSKNLNLDLQNNPRPEPIEIVLSPRATILGVVRDAGKKPVEGAEIRGVLTNIGPGLYGERERVLTAKSGADGQFELHGANEKGKYDLYAEHETAGVGIVQNVVAGEPAEIVLSPTGGSISGVVVRFEDGKPIQDVELELTRDGISLPGVVASARPNSGGYYEFTRLTAGYYQVNCMRKGRHVASRAAQIRNGEHKDDVDVVVKTETVSAGARVVDTLTDEPVAYAVAEGHEEQGGGWTFAAAANSDGKITLNEVAPGTYSVLVRAKGYGGDQFRLEVKARQEGEEEVSETVWKLTPLIVIYGKVLKPGGEAASGAEVLVPFQKK
jgi:hypothetical protein